MVADGPLTLSGTLSTLGTVAGGDVTFEAGLETGTPVSATGDFEMSRCRLWINFDNDDNDRHVCVAFGVDQQSGFASMGEDLDSGDRVSLVFLCDGGGSAAGNGFVEID